MLDELKLEISSSIKRLSTSSLERELEDCKIIKDVLKIFSMTNSYIGDFQDILLAYFRKCFKQKYNEWSEQQLSFSSYLQHSNKLLRQESNFMASYMEVERDAKILEIFDEEILETFKWNDLKDCEFISMTDIETLIQLCKRVPHVVIDLVKRHMYQSVQLLINSHDICIRVNERFLFSESIVPPNFIASLLDDQFINNLLDLLWMYYLPIDDFPEENLFRTLIRDSFTDIANSESCNHEISIVDLTVSHCDYLLRMPDHMNGVSDIQRCLDRCFILLSHCTDKRKLFDSYHCKMSVRLSSQRAINLDLEHFMISKLKLLYRLPLTQNFQECSWIYQIA